MSHCLSLLDLQEVFKESSRETIQSPGLGQNLPSFFNTRTNIYYPQHISNPTVPWKTSSPPMNQYSTLWPQWHSPSSQISQWPQGWFQASLQGILPCKLNLLSNSSYNYHLMHHQVIPLYGLSYLCNLIQTQSQNNNLSTCSSCKYI